MDKIEKLEKRISALEKMNDELTKEYELQTHRMYVGFNNLQKIYDSISSCIIVLNERGEIEDLNLSAKETLGENSDNIFNSLNNSSQTDEFAQTLINGEVESNDFELRIFNRQKDKYISYACTLTFLIGDTIDDVKFLLLATDMSKIKEEELKRSQLQNQLMERSFKEGMAENAVSILHNIGNVLTGITGAIQEPVSKKKFKQSLQGLEDLKKNFLKLNREESLGRFFEDPRKVDIFLKLMDTYKTDFEEYLLESEKNINQVDKKVQHISCIISTQQQYASMKEGLKSRVNLSKLIEDCLLINESKILKPHIKLLRDWDKEIDVKVEKNGFIQVLSNALINSIESVEEKIRACQDYSLGKISISGKLINDEIVVEVSDDGLGVKKENQEKLFSFGFSTKNRSSGFGLHNSYNFIKNQGGTIKLASDGENLGATFQITFPCLPDELVSA